MTPDEVKKIREHYQLLTPAIFDICKKDPSLWVSPYGLIHDWIRLMSPIEYEMWQAIRSFAKAPFYPQYPIDKYFLDFGNPVMKVGLECDGKEFHMDKLKDKVRDQVLDSMGWVIFRIPGSDCMKRPASIDRKYFYMETIEGLLTAISIYYFGYKHYSVDEEDLIFECLNKRASLRENKIHGTFR